MKSYLCLTALLFCQFANAQQLVQFASRTVKQDDQTLNIRCFTATSPEQNQIACALDVHDIKTDEHGRISFLPRLKLDWKNYKISSDGSFMIDQTLTTEDVLGGINIVQFITKVSGKIDLKNNKVFFGRFAYAESYFGRLSERISFDGFDVKLKSDSLKTYEKKYKYSEEEVCRADIEKFYSRVPTCRKSGYRSGRVKFISKCKLNRFAKYVTIIERSCSNHHFF